MRKGKGDIKKQRRIVKEEEEKEVVYVSRRIVGGEWSSLLDKASIEEELSTINYITGV